MFVTSRDTVLPFSVRLVNLRLELEAKRSLVSPTELISRMLAIFSLETRMEIVFMLHVIIVKAFCSVNMNVLMLK